MKRDRFIPLGLAVLLCLALPAGNRIPVLAARGAMQAPLVPLGTGFTYQGYLNDGGQAAQGSFDFTFVLYDVLVGGAALGTVEAMGVAVTNGYFTVTLDFGAGAFNGEARWLEISVRRTGESVDTLLSPRQALTPAPYASYAGAAPWSGLADVPAGFADGLDDDTQYAAGTGLDLTGTTFSVKADVVQLRVSGVCSAGYAMRSVNQDGTVVCEALSTALGDITAVVAGAGLAGGGASGVVTLTLDTSYADGRYWMLGGNSGLELTDVFGTTDAMTLTFVVDGNGFLSAAPDGSVAFKTAGASFTVDDYKIWHAGNDGSSSGVDADLLDGFTTGSGSGNIPINNGTLMVNLNADSLDSANTGSAVGNIPLNNGILNATLNADLFDGLHEFSFFRLSDSEIVTGIPSFNGGTTGATAPFSVDSNYQVSNLNADYLDGYDTGNASGSIPLNNGFLNTNLNADLLDGYDSNGFWKMFGNSVSSTGFLGTNNNFALYLMVNNQNVLRLFPDATSPNVIAGHPTNNLTSGASGAAIGGGGDAANPNNAYDNYAVVGGGAANEAGNNDGNVTTAAYATVGGGYSNASLGSYSSIIGGNNNIASGNYSTIGGGTNNEASGNYSFAAGSRARATHDGSFVWNDPSTGLSLETTAMNQFLVRSTGGIYFGTNSSGVPGLYAGASGCYLGPSGTAWTCASDVNLKTNFSAVDTRSVLEKVAALPINSWNLKEQDESIRHIGPMAQDFYAAFNLGDDNRYINTQDADGVALAAIQGLYDVVLEKDTRLEAQASTIAAQEERIQDLESRLAELEGKLGAGTAANPLAGLGSWLPIAFGLLGVAAGAWITRRQKGAAG